MNRIEIQGRTLIDMVGAVSKAIINKPAIPSLENIRVDINGTVFSLTGSDSETTVEKRLDINDTDSNLTFLVPAKPFAETIKGLENEILHLETDDSKLTIRWDSGNVSLPMLPPDEWLDEPKEEETERFTLSAQKILGGIELCEKSMAKDELRPTICGIMFDFKGDRLCVVGTDASVLTVVEYANTETARACSFIVPRKSSSVLKATLLPEDGMNVYLSDNFVKLQNDSTKITIRLPQGNYPNYASIFPTNIASYMNVTKKEIVSAWRRMNACANAACPHLRIELSNNAAILSAEDLNRSIEGAETVKCTFSGEPLTIGFNSNKFSQVVENAPYSILSFGITDEKTAVLIEDGAARPDKDSPVKIKSIVMPIMVN